MVFEGESNGASWERGAKPTAELAFWPHRQPGFSYPYLYKGKSSGVEWGWRVEDGKRKQVITAFTVEYPDAHIRLEGEDLTLLFNEIRTHICRDVFEDDPFQPVEGVKHAVKAMTVVAVKE